MDSLKAKQIKTKTNEKNLLYLPTLLHQPHAAGSSFKNG
jgi:hypothetical protein